jgi:hypothetical protein
MFYFFAKNEYDLKIKKEKKKKFIGGPNCTCWGPQLHQLGPQLHLLGPPTTPIDLNSLLLLNSSTSLFFENSLLLLLLVNSLAHNIWDLFVVYINMYNKLC